MIKLKSATWAIALVAAALMIFAGAKPARASLQLSIGNPGLEHFDADGGVQLDFGLTDNNGAAVGNLRPENVQVFEDGQPAKILDFRGQGQGRPVDIVFVFDITESMQPYIDAVKQNVITFAQDLASNNRDYRLGLVTFEDYVVSKEPDCNCPYRNKMTGNVQEFISWVGGLHAGGGGDIPEDQLDALAYAATFPFRPEAQGILILITDAPNHYAGDGSAHTQHDQAFWDHHPDKNADVTNLTGDQVAAMLKKNGLTLYAVVPPPFIAPDYAKIVGETHGRSYNIVTEEGRFDELVREIGHSIATEYSLTYRTPQPIENGTKREVQINVSYDGQSATARTSYQVRGVGGARINVPEEGTSAAGGLNAAGTGLSQFSFQWWNGAIPLIAIIGLLGLSRMRFGMSAEELKAILEARDQPAAMPSMRPAPARPAASASSPAVAAAATAPPRGACLRTVNPAGPVAAEYALLNKDELSLGRGEENDVVIPHASISRTHARLMRRGGGYELTDLNSTNGTYVNNQPLHGSAMVANGTEVRLGDVIFILQA
ncbi:MAG: FHA domain-containing protein [Candidatus Binataceae bacterium]|jgi:hypothetical protein